MYKIRQRITIFFISLIAIGFSIQLVINTQNNNKKINYEVNSSVMNYPTSINIPKTTNATPIIIDKNSKEPENNAQQLIDSTTITPNNLSYEHWKDWPVFPDYVSEELKVLYKQGINNGNDPHAFSIFGDCHSLPEVFLGIFDNNPSFVLTLEPSVKETIKNFQGSFNRYSPTVKVGTTEGALLWSLWNDNEEGFCLPNENAIDCELRVHKPSIVIIQVGTHYESRNEQYMIKIIEKLLDHKIAPIIVTKADNRDLDEHINKTLVKLAVKYDLPVWNFWASVQDLETKGINPKDNMYLSEEGYKIHQNDGIKVLDIIWHALNSD